MSLESPLAKIPVRVVVNWNEIKSVAFPKLLKHRCPFCRRVYAQTVSNVRLGPGVRRCSKCGRTFRDGSIEWPDASRDERREYLFPAVARISLLGELILASLLGLLARADRSGEIAIAIFVFLLAVFPWLLRLIICRLFIQRSIVRHRKQALSRMGYKVMPEAGAWPGDV